MIPARLIRLLFVAVLLIAAPVSAAGAMQDPGTPVPSDVTAQQPTESPPAAYTGAETSPFSEQAAPPRTLRAYWHVFIAFALAWVLLFGYVLVLGRRFARVEREMEKM